MADRRARKRELAIAALLSCATISDAAKEAKVGERTLSRWLSQPDFNAQLQRAKRRLLDSAINELRRSARGAVDVLKAVADDKAGPHAARVSAAAKILDAALRAASFEDLEDRLSVLETKLKATQQR